MSDEDEDKDKDKFDDADAEDFKDKALSPEDAKKAGELTDGVKKIKVRPFLCSLFLLSLATLCCPQLLPNPCPDLLYTLHTLTPFQTNITYH